MQNKRETGKRWEAYASAYLAVRGYTIIVQNYYTPYGEIDIIAEKEGVLIFAEVKYRSSHRLGRGRDAVGFKKQERIRMSALYYISDKSPTDKDIRFDVVEITGGQEISTEHIINAF